MTKAEREADATSLTREERLRLKELAEKAVEENDKYRLPGPALAYFNAASNPFTIKLLLAHIERLEAELSDVKSDFESFMEHHKATEAQNARLRAEAANRLPISKSVARRLDAQGVTGKVGKITKAEPR